MKTEKAILMAMLIVVSVLSIVPSAAITAEDLLPPLVTNPSANPDTIRNDGIETSQLNVTVTDASPISSVTVNLSSIGGSATQPMTNIPGTDIYTVTTTASPGTVPATYYLGVNATDVYGNSNMMISIELTVRGGTTVSIGNVCAAPGEENTTSVMINDVEDVGTCGINLTYDSSVVHVVSVTNSDFDFLDSAIYNADGYTRIGVMQLFNPGLNGDVKVCNVTLRAVGSGGETSPLDLVITEMKDATPPLEEIPRTVTNGTFTVLADTTPPVITNVDAAILYDTATITWDTDDPSDSLVKYGTESGNFDQSEYDPAIVTSHSIELTDLILSTTYYYVVNSTNTADLSNESGEYSFTTPSMPTVAIDDCFVQVGEETTTPIMINDVEDVGSCEINLMYNASVVHVTDVTDGDFDFLNKVIDNVNGITRIGAIQLVSPGLNGNVALCDVTLQAVGAPGDTSPLDIVIEELTTATPPLTDIPAITDNGTFFILSTPEITGFAPESPVITMVGEELTFNITIDQPVNVSWQINETEVQTNTSVTEASFSTTGAIGTWNVSTIASNPNGMDMQTWLWTVIEPAIVDIADATAPPGGSVITPIMIYNVDDVGDAMIRLTYNPEIVNVVDITNSSFDFMDSNINNTMGYTIIGAMQMLNPGLTGDVKLCDVTLQAVGSPGETSPLNIIIVDLDTYFGEHIPAVTDNGTFFILSTPEIIGFAPESPVTTMVGEELTFNITINQPVNVSWQINETEVQTNTSVTEASYTTIGAIGTWNVSAIVSNPNGMDMQTWIWNVVEPAIVDIEDARAPPGGNATTPIMIYNVTNLGSAMINLTFNASVVHVTNVSGGDFDSGPIGNIDNSAGVARIGAFQIYSPGLNGDVKLCDVELLAVGSVDEISPLDLEIEELKDATPEGNDIPAIVDPGLFTIAEVTPPAVTNPSAIPDTIPDDTDNDPRCGETSQLNITATDESGVERVTIDLSAIGGSATAEMTNIEGDIWSLETNASAGCVGTHSLQVNATDIYGNYNDSMSIELHVLNNGDVSEDGAVTLYDAFYLARHVLDKPGFEEINWGVAEVSGDCELVLHDAMYLAKHVLGKPGFETLH